jgi:peptidylprolyl isomerase
MFNEKDFIEIEYTNTIKESSQIIETTDADVAKKNNVYNPKTEYGPKVICIGQNQIFPALEEEIKDKELNKEYEIILPPEKAFGKKNPKLLQLVSMSNFKKQNLNPYPGLAVNIDNMMGIVRTVSPGRVIIDFNHPLANKTIIAKIKILKKVTDTKEQVSSIISNYIKDFKLEIKNDEAIILAKMPEPVQKEIDKKIPELVPIIKKTSIREE